MNDKLKIEISTISYIKFFGVIIGLIFLYWIKDILVLLFVVGILVSALDPMVSWAEERKVPRLFSTVILFLLIFTLITLLVSSIFPPIIDQMGTLANNLPDYIKKIVPWYYANFSALTLNWQDLINTISRQLSSFTSGFYNTTVAVFGGLVSVFTVFILSFYLLIDREGSKQFVMSTIPEPKRNVSLEILRKIALKMGSWFRGQVIVSSIMGIFSAVVLGILGIPYALTIGLLAAVLEIVPVVGPTVVAIISIFAAFIFGGWIKALIVLILGIVAQQLESHFLIPKIMGKAVGLSPVIIIIALLIGGKLAGITGAILAIPAAAGISVLIQEWHKLKN